MRLTNIEIFGFKSFLNKVEIPFGSGITSIVGPNGCGKSNIVEAIRWVLGEQRAGAVRGHRMEDVIFGGTRQRKPLGMSEVSLTIDNTNQSLPIEFSEVTVTRRLFRSGESDYLLNKIPCRLLDIQNLLMDTGLGPGAYSVMEQGMVDEIISERTENRRRILEEAAGITKYKARRRSTWNKLESTQADLTRLEDLISEVKRQVDYLGRQVGRAQRYQNLRVELEQLELLFGRHSFFSIQEQLTPLQSEFDKLSKTSISDLTELTAQEAELEKRRLAVTEAEKNLQTVGIELTRCVEQLHGRERELIVLRERRQARKQFVERATAECNEHKEQLSNSKDQREQTERELSHAKTRLQADADQLQKHEESVAAAETTWQSERTVLENCNTHLRATLNEREACGRAVERFGVESATLETARDQAASEKNKLQNELEAQNLKLTSAEKKYAEFSNKVTGVERDFTAATHRREGVEKQLEQAVEDRADLRRLLESNSARLQVMEKIKSGYEGYSHGVRNLMLDPERRELFRGVLADLIEVKPEYYKAVETALGDALHALVSDNDKVAIDAIRHLSDGSGRAGIFPLSWLRVQAGTAPVDDLPGILGPLSAYVQSTNEIRPLVDRLLHNTYVIDAIDTTIAAKSVERTQPIRLVTKTGEGVDFFGCLQGGQSSIEEDSGVLGRSVEINQLRNEIARNRAHLASAEHTHRAIESRRSILRRYTTDLEALVNELRDETRNYDLIVQETRSISGQVIDKQKEVEERSRSISEQLSKVSTALTNDQHQLNLLEETVSEFESNIRDAETRLEASENNRRHTSESLGSLRVERARAIEKIESLQRDEQRLKHIEQSHMQNITRLEAEIEKAGSDNTNLMQSEQQAENEIREMHKVRDDLTGSRDESQINWQEVVTKSREIEAEISKLQREVSIDRERRHKLEIEVTELQNEATRIRDRLQQDFNVGIDSQRPIDDEDFDPKATEQRLLQVRRSIERLGTVHVGVLEEYEEQKERYDFLVQHRDDLLAAADDLRKTLQLIDRTARRMFRETFDGIREKFKVTYSRFFPGGEADLVLEADADPLESTIEISARPRGKRLQSIALLSGGERALTAIALLFAIYQVKPSPWCILDEVDAPLDDANVDRFIRVLSEFAESTQFIMVTHNKLSMAAANTLHGVTMPEEGVSQMVSVEIEPEPATDS